jgi:hypothetical protein
MLNWLADQSFRSGGAGPTFVALRAGTQRKKKATSSSGIATPRIGRGQTVTVLKLGCIISRRQIRSTQKNA